MDGVIQGFSTARGFHAAVEGEYVTKYVTVESITKKLKPVRQWHSSIQTRTISYQHDTYSYAAHGLLEEMYQNSGKMQAIILD
jgi:hypothetical protein